jgi:hypothetical protein
MAPELTQIVDSSSRLKYNWPVVGLLLFLAGVPGIPAILILISIAMGAPTDGSEHAFVNVLHFTMPLPVLVHGGAGIVFFLTVPFQFSTALRKRHNRYHRLAGGIAIVSGYMIACSAPWMHHIFSPDSGLPRYSGLLAMSAGMIIGFSLALHAIIQVNIKKHRAWMMRSVAITLGAVTPLFFEIPLFLVFGSFEAISSELSRLEFGYGRWFGMVVNLAIVEYLLMKQSASTTRFK